MTDIDNKPQGTAVAPQGTAVAPPKARQLLLRVLP